MKEIKGFTKSYNHRFTVPESKKELSHHFRGIPIYHQGYGYVAEWGGQRVYACKWWKVEESISRILDGVDGKRTLKN